VASCPIRDQLEAQVYVAIQNLAKHSSRLVEITGTGNPAFRSHLRDPTYKFILLVTVNARTNPACMGI